MDNKINNPDSKIETNNKENNGTENNYTYKLLKRQYDIYRDENANALESLYNYYSVPNDQNKSNIENYTEIIVIGTWGLLLRNAYEHIIKKEAFTINNKNNRTVIEISGTAENIETAIKNYYNWDKNDPKYIWLQDLRSMANKSLHTDARTPQMYQFAELCTRGGYLDKYITPYPNGTYIFWGMLVKFIREFLNKFNSFSYEERNDHKNYIDIFVANRDNEFFRAYSLGALCRLTLESSLLRILLKDYPGQDKTIQEIPKISDKIAQLRDIDMIFYDAYSFMNRKINGCMHVDYSLISNHNNYDKHCLATNRKVCTNVEIVSNSLIEITHRINNSGDYKGYCAGLNTRGDNTKEPYNRDYNKKKYDNTPNTNHTDNTQNTNYSQSSQTNQTYNTYNNQTAAKPQETKPAKKKNGCLVALVISVVGVYLFLSLFGSSIGKWIESWADDFVQEQGTVIENGIQYIQNETGLTASVGDAAQLGSTVEIPAAVDGTPVTEIADEAFKNCTNVTTVIVPNTVTKIGKGAFQDCNNLTSITIPFVGMSEDAENQESVLGYIFGYETYTKELDTYYYEEVLFNDKPVSRVGATWQLTYQETYNYERIYFYYFIPESLTSVTVTKQTDIPDYAFNGCKNITSIKFENLGNKIVIGECAFQDCENLKFEGENGGFLNIDSNVIGIGSYAFSGCTNITDLVINDTVREIGVGAFYKCNNLQNITIPFVGKTEDAENYEAVFGYIFGYELVEKVIYDYPYEDTLYNDSPKEIVGATWQVTYQEAYFDTRQYYYYYIPESIASVTITKQMQLSAYAFNGCKNITEIILPVNCTVGEYGFQNCNADIKHN